MPGKSSLPGFVAMRMVGQHINIYLDSFANVTS